MRSQSAGIGLMLINVYNLIGSVIMILSIMISSVYNGASAEVPGHKNVSEGVEQPKRTVPSLD